MRSRASSRFWHLYHPLPPEIQRLANKSDRLWTRDHRHPSLDFKKVKNFWVARLSGNYRAVGVEFDGTVTWFWIGSHDEYERLIGGRDQRHGRPLGQLEVPVGHLKVKASSALNWNVRSGGKQADGAAEPLHGDE